MSDHEHSLDGARRAAENDDLAGWAMAFLESPGSDNEDLGEILQSEVEVWTGPIRLPFDRLGRLAGPAHQPTVGRMRQEDLETVEGMRESIEGGDWDPPPLIAKYVDGHLRLEDGNHRVEALRRAGRSAHWTIVGFDDEIERDAFVAGTLALDRAEQEADNRPSDVT